MEECDLLLSVLPPAEAVSIAEEVADAMARTGARPAFAECNAIAPQTVVRIATLILDTGAPFIDAGIIGSPPVARLRHAHLLLRPGYLGARVAAGVRAGRPPHRTTLRAGVRPQDGVRRVNEGHDGGVDGAADGGGGDWG